MRHFQSVSNHRLSRLMYHMYRDTNHESSKGPYSCIGKQLALMELRDVIAQLTTKFNVEQAPGYKTSPEQGMEDIFTVALGNLDLVFSLREKDTT